MYGHIISMYFYREGMEKVPSTFGLLVMEDYVIIVMLMVTSIVFIPYPSPVWTPTARRRIMQKSVPQYSPQHTQEIAEKTWLDQR